MSQDQIPPAPVYYSSRGHSAPRGAGADPRLAIQGEQVVAAWFAARQAEAALEGPSPDDEDGDDEEDGVDEGLAERLADLEQRVAQVEAVVASRDHAAPGSPDAASIAESLSRIADAMAPAPADVVGSPYVAKRLGCTTVWVAEMARDGRIPKHCLVDGTGSGKPWKFHRRHIDRWIASR